MKRQLLKTIKANNFKNVIFYKQYILFHTGSHINIFFITNFISCVYLSTVKFVILAIRLSHIVIQVHIT